MFYKVFQNYDIISYHFPERQDQVIVLCLTVNLMSLYYCKYQSIDNNSYQSDHIII